MIDIAMSLYSITTLWAELNVLPELEIILNRWLPRFAHKGAIEEAGWFFLHCRNYFNFTVQVVSSPCESIWSREYADFHGQKESFIWGT